jgi:hypothetical protein
MISFQRNIAGILLCFAMIFTLAASTPESCLLFSLTAQNTARLGIVNTSNKYLNLSITNGSGEIFFSKSVSGQQNYFQMLDLTKMPGGEYSIKLTGLDKPLEKKFVVSNATVQLIKNETDPAPLFRLLDDETLTVSYINSHKNEVNIRLEKDNDVVFEDKGLLDMALSRKYSLKKLPDGEYIVRLFSGEKTYSFPLVLK